MRQIKTFSDNRLDTQCAYCGEFPDTRDHVPSKILLEKPFPENLPVVPSCLNCNNGFSLDEEYFACLIECVICGTTEIDKLLRESIRKILKHKNKLKIRLDKALVNDNGNIHFKIETERVKNVLMKLAYGHAKFENSETLFSKPENIWFKPLDLMDETEREYYFSVTELQKAPEIGSREMQNLYLTESGIPTDNWNMVQDEIYIYSVTNTINNLKVRIIIWNYLACEIIWNN
ncbi:MAG: hypothetical protein ACOH1N_08635 [Lutibacter sp.]